jgi:hypothetical protein
MMILLAEKHVDLALLVGIAECDPQAETVELRLG